MELMNDRGICTQIDGEFGEEHGEIKPKDVKRQQKNENNNEGKEARGAGALWEEACLPGVGRVLLAARDIAPWERVLEDRAVVVAPTDCRVCLGCLVKLGRGEGVPCLGCDWPLCKDKCGLEGVHKEECRVLREAKMKPREDSDCLYSVLSVLRVLLLKQSEDQDVWPKVEGLMDHREMISKDQGTSRGLAKLATLLQKQLRFLRNTYFCTSDLAQAALGH